MRTKEQEAYSAKELYLAKQRYRKMLLEDEKEFKEDLEFLTKECWARELITHSRAAELMGIGIHEVRTWDRAKILEESL